MQTYIRRASEQEIGRDEPRKQTATNDSKAEKLNRIKN